MSNLPFRTGVAHVLSAITDVEPGAVVWLTGLSGAGKSTIAKRLSEVLAEYGCDVEYLDGDEVRTMFPNTGFSAADRDAHVRRLGFMASRLELRGVIVVAALISPQRESRAFVRRLCRNFIEVHVATPLNVCESRDPKGLYARARRGEIANFTGIHAEYESPVNPELTIDSSAVPVAESVARIIRRLGRAGVREHRSSRRTFVDRVLLTGS